MKHYGYLPPDTDTSAALYSEEGLYSVIKEIQRFGAIPQTGVLDNATLHVGFIINRNNLHIYI